MSSATTPSNATVVVDLPSLDVVACLLMELINLTALAFTPSVVARLGDDAARGHLDDRIKAHGVGIHAERRAADRGYRARGSQVHKRQPLDHGPMCCRTRLQLDAHQLASREDRPGRGSLCFVRA